MQTAVAVASSHWSDFSARRGSTSPQCLHILYTIIHFVALTLSYKGQRQLKVLDFSVEWYNLEHTPLIQLHFLTNRSPPLISQPVPKCRLTASPRGKPRGANFWRVRSSRVDIFVDPYSGRVRSSGYLRISGVTGGFYPPLRLMRAKRFLSGNESGGLGK